MPHIYTNTMPRVRTASKRGISKRTEHVARLEASLAAEKHARQQLQRELRVLRRVKFRPADQTESVRKSLQLINHTSP